MEDRQWSHDAAVFLTGLIALFHQPLLFQTGGGGLFRKLHMHVSRVYAKSSSTTTIEVHKINLLFLI